jgi:type VI secretion system protein ImpH
MAATSGRPPAPLDPPPSDALHSHGLPVPPGAPLARLFADACVFDFFQAVRLLERSAGARRPVGRGGPPDHEVARFAALPSLAFPPSSIAALETSPDGRPPVMTVAFMGLTGPSGVLPLHYTELLLRLTREHDSPEARALIDWLDLFNHRLISLFHRAWEKYRFYLPYERAEYAAEQPDAFTDCLLSAIGLGTAGLRDRLRVSARSSEAGGSRVLARVEDLALLHYSGLLAGPRCAAGLESLLGDYFGLPVEVRQFQGQWLILERPNPSRLGGEHSRLGADFVVGERVWDVQGQIRIRLGPLTLRQFDDFLPNRACVPGSKAFFLLAHLVRLFAGPELAFDVQLVLMPSEVPACRLPTGEAPAPRLGWNTWLSSQPRATDADDAVFPGEELFWLDPAAGYR